jgi:hypothetical protein
VAVTGGQNWTPIGGQFGKPIDNMIRNLYGKQNDRIDIDLFSLPSGPGGQSTQPASATARALARWVAAGEKWNREEKAAVRNLIFNYVSVFVSRLEELSRLQVQAVAHHWEEALRRVGIDPDLLKS